MAVAVAGHWELSWSSPIKEADLWNLPLRDFGVSEWWMWPVSGVRNNEQRTVQLFERDSLRTILEDNGDTTKVFVEAPGFFDFETVMLNEFEHPDDVLYIFGSAHFNPTVANMREDDVAVTIPTVEGKGVLWPHQCLVTVLYDRLVKSWQ